MRIQAYDPVLPKRELGSVSEPPPSPKELLRSLEERSRLYKVLKEEGLINRHQASRMEKQLKQAICDLEEIIKTTGDVA